MKLSKHFTLDEFVRSTIATKRFIENKPGLTQVINLSALCHNVLEPIRKQFGPVLITSGYRSLKLNQALGSKDTSQHIAGEAADWITKEAQLEEVFHWCIANINYDQIIFEQARDMEWIHSSFVITRQNRQESLLYDGLNYKEINNG